MASAAGEKARLREERVRLLHRKAWTGVLLMLIGLSFILLSLANGALMLALGAAAVVAGGVLLCRSYHPGRSRDQRDNFRNA